MTGVLRKKDAVSSVCLLPEVVVRYGLLQPNLRNLHNSTPNFAHLPSPPVLLAVTPVEGGTKCAYEVEQKP